MKLSKNERKIGKTRKKVERGGRQIMRQMRSFVALFCLISATFGYLIATSSAQEGVASGRLLTEQEVATEKFFSSLEAALAKKFFDHRKRPVIRVAIFDFTDEAGNVVKSGRELADKITRRLYGKPQFEVVGQGKINRYLSWSGLSALGKLDAESLYRLQRRINTMDPNNGIHVLVRGEVKKGVGRSLRVLASLVDFRFKIGAIELEKNIFDHLALTTEIPLPTEQALQEASEILIAGEKRLQEEGRLLILVNTRGNPLWETEYGRHFSKDQAFPWAKIPHVLTLGKAEVITPEQLRIGLEKLLLSPLGSGRNSKGLEYSFLHGKCATNEVYFDEMIPAQSYRLTTSFVDLRTNETYSQSSEVQVDAGVTTLVVLSIYVPSEKERIRNKETPRIDVFQLFGKGMEILPK